MGQPASLRRRCFYKTTHTLVSPAIQLPVTRVFYRKKTPKLSVSEARNRGILESGGRRKYGKGTA
jgi:hypothetical protein